MDINFDPTRLPDRVIGPKAARPEAASPPPSASPPSETTDLQSKLQNIPLVRPGKVEQARSLLSDTNFPPDYVLDRIATLLAVHTRSN